jgi:hypothetical protein|tara:strand:+ start:425 stop:604 length:180 start_codon:yes stop_codon:yes gene_type:complete
MGMMDGGLNFRDTCYNCATTMHGGSMRRYVHNRNTKICDTCYEEHDNKNDYVYARELKK